MPARWITALFLAAVSIPACGGRDDMPPLHSVTGKVLRNGQPVSGGALAFRNVNEQAVIIVRGQVREDGTFQLTTIKGRTEAPGAPEGVYRVTYSSPKMDKLDRSTFPVTSEETYKVEAKTNEFTFDVGGKKPF
jgi:hypothetical protein